ncbi:MAG: translation elongation factor Ts [Deltaproteobacteria bacterium]|nr:translation elongation factor Ts [Deltaproteobacteria bacterium]MCZ6713634.1 translation elongation factor Ts [Deltaproteobacteria bacterium]MCZ6821801.1 translation elongation factor Ts [Deltaproteobacteria bacterium]TDI95400.1 MAG: elongation factor Ts [Deltaproteobacteria bacterium]
MAEITAVQVKALRERTDAGMMDCKRALVEAGGDAVRATDLLRERGLAKARGKAGRSTSEGCIVAGVSANGRRAALAEVNCETDFVARTDQFESLCQKIVEPILEQNPRDVNALLALSLEGGTVNERVVGAVATLGENIQVRRFVRLEAPSNGLIGSYIHAGGKIGSLVQVEADEPSKPEVQTIVRNVCMHVAATNPLGVARNDIPQEEVERERAVLSKQAQTEGKPAHVVEKIVAGRLGKFFREVVLLEEPLVMDPERTVEAAVKEAGARVIAFRRFQLGEELDES